jgi:ATP-dependent Lhr-like helicase
MLRTARTVILDEIHAVIGTRRGAHLALTLERLQHVARRRLQRIGLSATQTPIDLVGRYLVGSGEPPPVIVDEGHMRPMDLALEVPGSPLEAVMSHEVWSEYYDRLTSLIGAHRTTLVFVNTRRMAERIARQLSDRLGDEAVAAHHGSLSKEKRLDAETRLKTGRLRALVATSSLELGIDIGHVDLVCQIGSPHRLATFLQRVGRSGHAVQGLPKGRLFPISRDDLVECAALLRAVRRGSLDALVAHEAPLDVLAQQIVAEASSQDHAEDDLFALVRRAWPYRDLSRADFDAVVAMAAEGFTTRRGRRGALLHRDEVNRRVRGRRGARSLAITSGGAIPEVADYRVVLDPGDLVIGTLNEDFAVESQAGDIIQLGNASWQILKIEPGVVRVADARGAPPTLPFWFGEAPARSDELSREVSNLRREIEQILLDGPATHHAPSGDDARRAVLGDDADARARAARWMTDTCGIPAEAAEQAVAYLAEALRALGALPTQDVLVLERFFDESGGMQLVLHAPFGSRVNRAWGLALRKRFCRQFNFELQAAATENGVLLSLGPQHSFPLADVFRYLHPATVRDVLVQAVLDAPVFQTRWRWNATVALAVPRNRHGRKVPPPLQRMLADDLLAAAFPDAAACLENVPGDRRIPDHPVVSQTLRDCLYEAMDLPALCSLLERIHRGEIRCVARDTTEPSPLCHELLTARPYAFLDDAPLEERRAHAVYTRRAGAAAAGALGALDPAAIARVLDEARPDPRDPDELHDALVVAGWLAASELPAHVAGWFAALAASQRAARARSRTGEWIYVAAERLPELTAVAGTLPLEPPIEAPASRTARAWTREDALVELLRGRLAIVGPTTARELGAPLALDATAVERALETLEADGVVLRGRFRPESHAAPAIAPAHGSGVSAPRDDGTAPAVEWCDRGVLARIHRYTLDRLRAEIEPVSPADFMRFLFDWQHLAPASRLSGPEGVRAAIDQLEGFEIPAAAWEAAVLSARVDRYDPAWLDQLCLTGQVSWARLSPPRPLTRVVRATPIALAGRERLSSWRARVDESDAREEALTPEARAVLHALRAHGAMFAHEIVARCALDAEAVRQALALLVAAGRAASDGFGGLRGLIGPRAAAARRLAAAGRWFTLEDAPLDDRAIEVRAMALLARYGIVFRRLLAREAQAPPWRLLVRVYRLLEARGDIRGGRFVSGMAGEQFALPEAVRRLREIRRTPPGEGVIVVSACDPLNLSGIVTAGERIFSAASTRIAYRRGVPLAVLEGDFLRPLVDLDTDSAGEVARALSGRRVPALARGFVGRAAPTRATGSRITAP